MLPLRWLARPAIPFPATETPTTKEENARMLRGIHKASGSWLGKLIMAAVMGVLVISFAIWGIGDIFRGFGLNSVAKVGGTEISIDQFRQFYNERLQQLSRRLGRPISPDQARGLGLDRQLVGQLIAEIALDEKAHDWRLGLGDAEIARIIMSDANFRGVSGQFDHDRFVAMIRNAGFSEGRYIAEQRRVLLRRQVAQSISGALPMPKTMIAAVNQFQNETRSAQYVTLGHVQAGDIAQPSAETLTKYFDERKTLFRAPEYRKVTMLSVTPADLAKPDTVSDADAKADYDQHKDKYGSPEKRELHQMVFPDLTAAAAAHERIAKGLSFADLAKERGLQTSDTDLGMVSKADVIDPAVGEAAFSLKPGDVSEPVKGAFGAVLLQVGKVEPGSQQPYDAVAPQIKKEIAESRAKSLIESLRDKIEDDRAAGSTLPETAKKLGLTAATVDAVDRSGRRPDGTFVAELPKTPDVVSAAFATNVGVDNDALQMPGGGYLWYDVAAITPTRERNFDEVKDQVAARWHDDEVARILQAKAGDMLGKLKLGSTLAQVAAEAGVKVENAADLKRNKPTEYVSAKLLQGVFTTTKGGSGAAEGANQDERVVFTVTDILDAKLDANSPDAKRLEATLQASYSDDILGEYLARLESDLGVTLNQAALNQVIGGGTPNQ
jgi:peptidyl-prolyl cis-trans isomerase D